MKKVYIVCLIILLISCKDTYKKSNENDNTISKDYFIDIIYYVENIPNKSKNYEKVKVNYKNYNDSIKYIYNYAFLKESNDTLIISKSITKMENIQLCYLSSKNFMINNKKYTIKKYSLQGIHAFTNFYINESGIVITRTAASISSIVVEYDTINNAKLIEAIKNDKEYFDFQFRDCNNIYGNQGKD